MHYVTNTNQTVAFTDIEALCMKQADLILKGEVFEIIQILCELITSTSFNIQT
jgi:hypothetical protein